MQTDIMLQHDQFYERIQSLLGSYRFKVYTDYKSSSSDRLLSIVGVTHIDNIDFIQNDLLSVCSMVLEIDTPHYRGVYFEDTSLLCGIIIAAKRELISLEQGIYNQSRDARLVYELQNFGTDHQIKNLIELDLDSCVPMWAGDDNVIAERYPDINVRYVKYRNSHHEYKRNYLSYMNRERSYLHCAYNSPQYNSLEAFSWIYYCEIMMMTEAIGSSKISIHDVGTSVAQFPLLLSSLSEEELMGLKISKIIASDIDWTGKDLIQRIHRRNPGYRPIEFLSLDLLHSDIPVTDVIVINDVLEHMPSEEASFTVFQRLWRSTGKLLVVHVPFEEVPNQSWDHYIVFNRNKLHDWVERLDGAKLISDKYFSDNNMSLVDHGFLVLEKE